MPPPQPQIAFLGCPLDCDEQHTAIQEKIAYAGRLSIPADPLAVLLPGITRDIPPESWRTLGSLAIPAWLSPVPPADERGNLGVEACIDFLDQNGVRHYAQQVRETISEQVLPNIPCLIAVDHGLTGGAYEAVASYYGKDQVSLVILDSHTDAIPMAALAGAIQYDIATNPRSPHDPNDPFLYNRPDSYNASSFLHHLLREEILSARQLFLIGVCDTPDPRAMKIKDPRLTDYQNVFSGLKQSGATVLTQSELRANPQRLNTMLRRIGPYVYVSIDMDIGANTAVEAVRFRNWNGLQYHQIDRIVAKIRQRLDCGCTLAGLDIVEINPRRAGQRLDSGRVEPAYQLACAWARRLLFGR